MPIFDRHIEWKLQFFRKCLSQKGHNPAKNYWTWAEFKFDLPIFMTYLYSEFQLKMSLYDEDNERKL